MNVATILNDKGRNVITANVSSTLYDIAKILAENRIGSIVVVDGDGSVAGIISERDIVRSIGKSGPDVLKKQVTFSMTKDVITCQESETIDEIMSQMSSHRFRHLPVVEGGKLVGIVSIGDVVKMRIAEVEMEAAAMRQYIATG